MSKRATTATTDDALRIAARIAMRTCRKWRVRKHEIDDFVQDARIRVWRVYSKLNGHAKPSIALLVQCAMADTARKLLRWRSEPGSRKAVPTSRRTLDTQDLHRYITTHASPRMRAVLSLRLQGVSRKKIAKRLRMDYGTVRRMLSSLQGRYRMGAR